jgi:DNA-binding transcriptional ArsR family regulator
MLLPADAPLGDDRIAPTASLLADPARVAILWAVSDGRALPAGELAWAGQVSAAAASAHLAKLTAGGLLAVERHGRHRYYRLADPAIVRAMEALAAATPRADRRSRAETGAGGAEPLGPSAALRRARTCYDHLAGTLGVGVAEALVKRGTLVLEEGNYVLTGTGTGDPGFAALGLDVAAVRAAAERRRRPLARACLDWSERRYHLAGALGAALTRSLLDREWVERVRGSRALRVTSGGRRALRRHFGVQVW